MVRTRKQRRCDEVVKLWSIRRSNGRLETVNFGSIRRSNGRLETVKLWNVRRASCRRHRQWRNSIVLKHRFVKNVSVLVQVLGIYRFAKPRQNLTTSSYVTVFHILSVAQFVEIKFDFFMDWNFPDLNGNEFESRILKYKLSCQNSTDQLMESKNVLS